MFQGTGSDVGKSLLTAGLCRAYTRRGLRFGRSSRRTCRTTPPSPTTAAKSAGLRRCRRAPAASRPVIDMNPVLLKPQTDVGAQVVVQGRILGNAAALDYAKP
jgi:adenosylcobyric acid synthase